MSPNADGSGSWRSGICRADCTKAVGTLLGQGAVQNNTLLEISVCTSWLAVLLLLKVSGGEVLFSRLRVCISNFFLPPIFFLASSTQNIFLKAATNSVIHSPILKHAYVCKQTPSTESRLTQTWVLRGYFSDQIPALGEAFAFPPEQRRATSLCAL